MIFNFSTLTSQDDEVTRLILVFGSSTEREKKVREFSIPTIRAKFRFTFKNEFWKWKLSTNMKFPLFDKGEIVAFFALKSSNFLWKRRDDIKVVKNYQY